MYTWSQQRNLKIQAPVNMEGLLRNILPNERPRPNDFYQHASLPLSNASTVSTLATLRLEEELDALKRQNQEAILMLLAQHSNAAYTLPTVGSSHHHSHDYVTTGTGLIEKQIPLMSRNDAMPESPPMLSRHVVSHSASEILEKQRQDMMTKHQVPDEIEVADPKPKRPLSAYNIFFQEERQKIMQNPSCDEDKETAHDLPKSESLDSIAHSDDSKKRKRYEPHRKMSFEKMGKTIAKRWKETVSDETKMQPYQERAKVERERYFTELAQWKRRQRDYYNSK